MRRKKRFENEPHEPTFASENCGEGAMLTRGRWIAALVRSSTVCKITGLPYAEGFLQALYNKFMWTGKKKILLK